MRKFAQKEFDNFEVDEYGGKICPTGDYTAIKEFSDGCHFGNGCNFSEQCRFGEKCIFGEKCTFGRWCSFGGQSRFNERCRFEEGCRFGRWCSFGGQCRFGKKCTFGEKCRFGEHCGFDKWCKFNEDCRFDEHCSFEGGAVKNGGYIAIDRIGSENRKAYFFIDESGKIYVRAGCWFSDLGGFKERIKEVHAGTIHEKTYLAACDFAEMVLKETGK